MTRHPDHTAFTRARYQYAGRTIPAFTLSTADLARLGEVETMCSRYRANPSASIELELEYMHRAHYYAHRPILGVANILTVAGDLAFSADWSAHRDEHMAEAFAEYERATAPVMECAI